MKTEIILAILTIVTIIIIIIAATIKKRENLLPNQLTARDYTHPNPHETLRNPNQLPGNFYRPSNTLLVPAPNFTDAMDKLDLPDNVKDQFTEWIDKGYATVAKDQMSCGGCWAFAVCETISARLAIATNGKWNNPFGLSEQYLISCAGEQGMQQWDGCQGGIPYFAIDIVSKEGLPRDIKDLSAKQKISYYQTIQDPNSSCSLTPSTTCPCSTIKEKFPEPKFSTIGQAHAYTTHGPNNEIHPVELWPDITDEGIKARNVMRMKKAIYYEGPLVVGFAIADDFYDFHPTIDNYYKYDKTSNVGGGHAVAIAGWKKLQDGTPVWVCKNSWGDNWGYGFPDGAKFLNPITNQIEIKYKGGYWNHIMGVNDSFIESNAVGAHPDLTDPDILPYLPNNGKDIPKNWFETMTLRDIYNHNLKPDKPPDQTKKKNETDFVVKVNVAGTGYSSSGEGTSLSVAGQSVKDIVLSDIVHFFNSLGARFVIAGDRKMFDNIVKYLPSGEINGDTMDKIVNDIRVNIKDYVIVGISGSNGVKYWILGDPTEWGTFNIYEFVGRTTDSATISTILFEQMDPSQTVFFAISTKENFTMFGNSNSSDSNMNNWIDGCNWDNYNGDHNNIIYQPTVGINCGNGNFGTSCNAKKMDMADWQQSLQRYPNINNVVYSAPLETVPTAYGGFLAYDRKTWEMGEPEKLESADWRWVYGRSIGPGSVI